MSTAMVNQGNSGAEGRTSREFGAVVPAVSQDSKANTPPPPVCWYSGLWCIKKNEEEDEGVVTFGIKVIIFTLFYYQSISQYAALYAVNTFKT